MADYGSDDFFELTDIAFDKPERSGKKVADAIDKALGSLGSLLGRAHQAGDRDAINSRIAMLNQCRSDFVDASGRLTPKFKQAAGRKKDSQVKVLQTRIRLEQMTSESRIVTRGKVRETMGTFHLSEDTVVTEYQGAGYTYQKADANAAMPKFPTNAERTASDLARLRSMRNPNPSAPDHTHVADLYDFVAYLDGDPTRGAECRSMPTSALCDILANYARDNAMRTDAFGALCKDIASAGKTYSFDSEAHRSAYDKFLVYKGKAMQEVAAMIAVLGESDLRNQTMAETLIGQIMAEFGDRAEAVALYNHEAARAHRAFATNPFEPVDTKFVIRCPSCGGQPTFSDINVARKTNKCPICGKPLYHKCPQCSTLFPADGDRCPSCGHLMASVAMFGRYLAGAEDALSRGDFGKAKSQATLAESADPSRAAEVRRLRSRVDKAESEVGKKLRDLQSLMTSHRYVHALAMMDAIGTTHPNIDVSRQRKTADDAIATCTRLLASVASQSKANKVNACISALDTCSDYEAAQDLLDTLPPDPPTSVRAVADSKSISVYWQPSQERGVSYVVTRKKGTVPPANQNDGMRRMLGKGVTSVTDKHEEGRLHADSSIVSGVSYAYSVFAVRGGTSSVPASATAICLAPVENVSHVQVGNDIHVSWELPPRATAAVVRCSCEGREVFVDRNATEMANIRGAKMGKKYILSVMATYGALGNSVVRETTIYVAPVVDPFPITCRGRGGTSYEVGWAIDTPDADVRVIVDGRAVTTVKSGARFANITLTPNASHKVSARVRSGNGWVDSRNTVPVNTFGAVGIDARKTEVTEQRVSGASGSYVKVSLSIKMDEPLPDGVKGFIPFVRTRKSPSAPAPWVGKEELDGLSGMKAVSDYTSHGDIHVDRKASNEDAYYLTVYTVYAGRGGEDCISEPAHRRISRPLKASMSWKASRGLFGGTPKLNVTWEANRPMQVLPAFTLVSSVDGKAPRNAGDTSAAVLLSQGEETLDTPSKRVTRTYPVTAGANLPRKSSVFMFVTSKWTGADITPQWTDGYNGKF